MKDVVKLNDEEYNLLYGIVRDEQNLLETINYCCNEKEDNVNNDKFKILIELKEQKSFEKEVLIKALILKYNSNNREYYTFANNFAEMVFYNV